MKNIFLFVSLAFLTACGNSPDNSTKDFINANLDCFSGVQIPAPLSFYDRIETKYFVEK